MSSILETVGILCPERERKAEVALFHNLQAPPHITSDLFKIDHHMDKCILWALAGQNLSDDIVGDVLQRRMSNRSRYVAPDQQTNLDESWDKPCNSPAAVDGEFSPTNRKRKNQESHGSLTTMSKLLIVSSGDLQSGRPKHQLEGGKEQQAVITEWVPSSYIKHQREIRRLRQIRYRKKKEDYSVSLEEGNRKLQQEIEKLQRRQRAISANVPSEKTPWNIVVEYFRLFRFGFQEPLATSRGLTKDMQPSAQLNFLRTTMASDVVFNRGRGVESIVTDWAYFTLWFQDVEIELDGLVKSGMGSLVASTTTHFTIVERSLVQIFPCLRKCKGSEDSSLSNKLLGQRIVMRSSMRFEWDSSYGRVLSIISESDMLTPMLEILGCLEDVSRVFERSLISLAPFCVRFSEL